MSTYTGKSTGVFSTASPVLFLMVAFEATLFGAMVAMNTQEKHSTTLVTMGQKDTRGKKTLIFCKSNFTA